MSLFDVLVNDQLLRNRSAHAAYLRSEFFWSIELIRDGRDQFDLFVLYDQVERARCVALESLSVLGVADSELLAQALVTNGFARQAIDVDLATYGWLSDSKGAD